MPIPILKKSDLERIQTDDRSMTLRHKALDVHYRSTYGALTESFHIFIHGSQILKQSEWTVVELGFGTAMNFHNLVSCNTGQPIHYIAIDHQPIPPECIPGTNLSTSMAREALTMVRRSQKSCLLRKENITLELHPFSFSTVDIQKSFAMAFFHDPFEPSINPDCWTKDCFLFAKKCLDPNGVLATYGAAGHAKRAMAAAGFFIGCTSGPGKKREVTFASSRLESLRHTKIITKYPPSLS
jgi:tRNA U34 5-methylaminomethyl-2-thiouridine-forming methyltransferase MnmC